MEGLGKWLLTVLGVLVLIGLVLVAVAFGSVVIVLWCKLGNAVLSAFGWTQ